MTMRYQLMADFQKRVQALDKKARTIAPGLFLFDEYCPKKIPENIRDDEIALWYLIVDLYGLFFDSGKYVFNTLEWSRDDSFTVKAFQDALNETRSIFCHNKPSTAFLPVLITDNNSLNKLVAGWKIKAKPAADLLTGNFRNPAPYRELFDLFLEAASKMLDLIDTKFLDCLAKYPDDKRDDEIYENWFVPIFDWYWENTTAYVRAWNRYHCIKTRSACMPFGIARDAKNIGSKLKSWLSGHGCAAPATVKQFRHNMYYRHFSLHAGAASRQSLTPFNLFGPLLRAYDTRLTPKSLFEPDVH